MTQIYSDIFKSVKLSYMGHRPLMGEGEGGKGYTKYKIISRKL